MLATLASQRGLLAVAVPMHLLPAKAPCRPDPPKGEVPTEEEGEEDPAAPWERRGCASTSA